MYGGDPEEGGVTATREGLCVAAEEGADRVWGADDILFVYVGVWAWAKHHQQIYAFYLQHIMAAVKGEMHMHVRMSAVVATHHSMNTLLFRPLEQTSTCMRLRIYGM